MNRLSGNIFLAVAAVMLLASTSCNERPATTVTGSGVPAAGMPNSGSASAQNAVYAASEDPAAGTGEVVGHISLRGAFHPLPPLQVTGSVCSQSHSNGVPDESVVATADGRLANVFVHVRGVPTPDLGAGSTAAPVVLNQVNCQYSPHVVALQVGQSLQIRSADAVLHNVHGMSNTNPAFNLAQTAAGDSTHLEPFKAAEIFPVRCDVHPWMKAWIGVFPDSYFAVSQPDGGFRIHGVPPGTYTLAAWHERLGELTQQVTVADGKAVTINFEYARP